MEIHCQHVTASQSKSSVDIRIVSGSLRSGTCDENFFPKHLRIFKCPTELNQSCERKTSLRIDVGSIASCRFSLNKRSRQSGEFLSRSEPFSGRLKPVWEKKDFQDSLDRRHEIPKKPADSSLSCSRNTIVRLDVGSKIQHRLNANTYMC